MGRSTESQTFGDHSGEDAPSGRYSERAPTESSGTISWTAPGQRFYTQTAVAINRSEAGYGFQLRESPAVGQRVQVDLPPARRHLGTVRHATWVDGTYNVGVEMDPEPLYSLDVEE